MSLHFSQIFRRQAGMLGDTCQHLRSKLLLIMKCENAVGPTYPSKHAVRSARLPFDRPTNAKQGSEDLTSFGRRPMAHDDTANTSFSSGISSPYSSLSAMTRKANASAFETASFRLSPYAMTPGSAGISAIHRPSSSLSISTFILSPQQVINPGIPPGPDCGRVAGVCARPWPRSGGFVRV